MAELQVQYIDPQELKPFADNPRHHSERNIQDIQRSIKKFGFTNPILVRQEDNMVVAGHGRLQSAQELGLDEVPVIYLDFSENDAKLYAITDNRTAETSEWDLVALDELVQSLEMDEDELPDTGFYADELEEILAEIDSTSAPQGEEQAEVARQTLAQRFLVPPFSVLDARQGYWQERKRAWMGLIGDSGETREGKLSNLSSMTAMFRPDMNTVSVLDPVLAELVVRWFGIEGGTAFDCFAGDTVFGYVSSYLGQQFTGIELRAEQAGANSQRIAEFEQSSYICDDGQNVAQHLAAESQDLFFSCPPYFDLEVYSDLPNDASNQESYQDFLSIIDTALAGAMDCLKPNRFAVVVLGGVRGRDGFYLGLVDDIKRVLARQGAGLYNDLVLIDPLGTAPARASRYMRNRKVVKAHQNVLVFYKGDPSQISTNYPELEYEIGDLESELVD